MVKLHSRCLSDFTSERRLQEESYKAGAYLWRCLTLKSSESVSHWASAHRPRQQILQGADICDSWGKKRKPAAGKSHQTQMKTFFFPIFSLKFFKNCTVNREVILLLGKHKRAHTPAHQDNGWRERGSWGAPCPNDIQCLALSTMANPHGSQKIPEHERAEASGQDSRVYQRERAGEKNAV